MRTARIAAGEALLARLSHPPLGDCQLARAARGRGGPGRGRRSPARGGGDEELGDDARAADAYGAIGDSDQMEASLEREDARLRAAREALDELRSFESLMAAGQRRAALEAASRIPGDLPTSAGVRQRARDVESRLVRERAVTLRSAGAGSALLGPIRFAAVPATLGRELLAQVPDQDSSVSRRHAVIAARDGELHIEDAGSRAGVRVGGRRAGRAPAPARRGRAGPRPRLPHPLPLDGARARDPARRLGPGPAAGGGGRHRSLPARGAHPRRRRDLARSWARAARAWAAARGRRCAWAATSWARAAICCTATSSRSGPRQASPALACASRSTDALGPLRGRTLMLPRPTAPSRRAIWRRPRRRCAATWASSPGRHGGAPALRAPADGVRRARGGAPRAGGAGPRRHRHRRGRARRQPIAGRARRERGRARPRGAALGAPAGARHRRPAGARPPAPPARRRDPAARRGRGRHAGVARRRRDRCATAWCASSAAAARRRSISRATRCWTSRSRSRCCTRSWPGPRAPRRGAASLPRRGSRRRCATPA